MDIKPKSSLRLAGFIQLLFNGKVKAEFEIRTSAISVGRSPQCDITIDNAAVSSFHAILSQRDGRYFLEDAASTNGIIANGAKTNTVELGVGDEVNIAGKYSLRLVDTPIGIASERGSPDARAGDVQKETALVDTSTLVSLSRGMRPAFLTLSAPNRASWVCMLDKPSISFGRRRSCDVRTGGWFAPSVIGAIERREDGYYFCVKPGQQAAIDNEPIVGERPLRDGNRLSLEGLSGVFHERARADR